MLTSTQIQEIKEHLEKAQNPVFFFDNDADGLCSFLLLQRYLGRGKGVVVKSFPDLNANYFKKISELNADYVFILDKPVVSGGFWKEVEQINIPVVWIDHHEIQIEIPAFVSYYNPVLNTPKSNEPVSALCFQITNKKDDLWLAVAGSISDKFVPDFYKEFKDNCPDLSVDSDKDAFDILYKSQIGKIARIFGFALKDRVTNVIYMQKFLMKVKTPYEVLEENNKNFTMHQRFNFIEKKYRKFIDKAVEIERNSSRVLFFQYGGDLSISADLSNELSYRFPNKIVIVVYIAGAKANISVRGKKIREKILKAIEGLEGATGGGHEDAVGAQVKVEDLEKFRARLKELVE